MLYSVKDKNIKEKNIRLRKKFQKKVSFYLIICLICVMLLFLTACSKSNEENNGDEQTLPVRVQDGNYTSAIEKANVGDMFILGSCDQDANKENGNEPIYWRVLDKNNNGILLLSEYILSSGKYDYNSGNITWEKSSARNLWNDSKFYELFTDDEIKHIAWVNVENKDNLQTGIEAGNNTKDRLFFLSLDEVNKYFPRRIERCAETWGESQDWWLRTPRR